MSDASSPSAFLRSFLVLLVKANDGPFNPALLSTISRKCALLKEYGVILDHSEKDCMDRVQEEMNALCQDPRINLDLRLQLLELIELRSLNWLPTRSSETFYREKYAQLSRRREGVEESADDCDISEEAEAIIEVGPVKLFLCSNDLDVTMAAKEQLENYFNNNSSSRSFSRFNAEPTICYPRETLLMLANSAESKKAPVNWASMKHSLPRVIIK